LRDALPRRFARRTLLPLMLPARLILKLPLEAATRRCYARTRLMPPCRDAMMPRRMLPAAERALPRRAMRMRQRALPHAAQLRMMIWCAKIW